MKKALHNDKEIYFSFRKGEITAWRINDVDMLIGAANDAPDYEESEKNGFTILKKDGVVVTRIPEEDSFCTMVHDWMCDLVDKGVTDVLIDELNDVLVDIRYIHVLMPSEGGTPYWQNNIADMNRSLNVEEAAGYAFSHQLAIGGLEGLKRCQLPDCEKFFIGRPNAKWCSASCGSKYRVRKKRKRDVE